MFDFRQERHDEIFEVQDVLPDASPPAAAVQPIVQPGFQLPASIWQAMIACYVIFFTAMAVLVGSGGFALFMVAISIFYTVVYFSAGALLALLPGLPDNSPLDEGRPLDTWCGPMDRKAVWGQVLVVPVGIAFFGTCVALLSKVL